MGFAPSTYESRGFVESGGDDALEEARDLANACLIESIRPQVLRVIMSLARIHRDRGEEKVASSLLSEEWRLLNTSPVD